MLKKLSSLSPRRKSTPRIATGGAKDDKQKKAATTLQANWRGRAARKANQLAGSSKHLKARIGGSLDRQASAATRLQASWRGRAAREELYWASMGYGESEDEEP